MPGRLPSGNRRPGECRREVRRASPTPWYVARALRRKQRLPNPSTRAGLCALGAAVVLAGCGVKPQQNEDEPTGQYMVEIVKQEFPKRQKLAKNSQLEIAVKNVDQRAVPNINLHITGFESAGASGGTTEFRDAEKTDPQDPMMVINEYPVGSDTAYDSTYALGNLDPGQTKTFRFDITALQRGPYRIRYRVQGGLDGKARAVTPDGAGPVAGEFRGLVEGEAPTARVADDGETIIREGERIGPETR